MNIEEKSVDVEVASLLWDVQVFTLRVAKRVVFRLDGLYV